jgi:hypothetical protein
MVLFNLLYVKYFYTINLFNRGYAMKPTDVKEHFGTAYKFYKATGMSPANLGNWLKWGFVPIKSQYKIEDATNGKLKAEWRDCQ